MTEDKYRVHSQEVDELMESSPSWLTRWGISSLFAASVLLVAMLRFISFSDLVEQNGQLQKTADQLLFAVQLNQANAAKVKAGNKALIQLDALIGQAAPLEAEVWQVSSEINSQSLKQEVLIKLEAEQAKGLENNMSGNATIILEETNLLKKFSDYFRTIF